MKKQILIWLLLATQQVQAQYYYDTVMLVPRYSTVNNYSHDTLKRFLGFLWNYKTITTHDTTMVDYMEVPTVAVKPEFGVLPFLLSADDKITVARQLNTSSIREDFTSQVVLPYPRLYRYQDEGLSVFTTINWQPSPAPFPTDLVAYRSFLNKFFSYHSPKAVFIENEPMTEKFHTEDRNLQHYIEELKVAIEVSHAHKIKIGDGGITTHVLPGITYRELLKTDPARAQWFLDNCIPEMDKIKIVYGKQEGYEQQLADAYYLINAYKKLPLDYVNLHLYFPFNEVADNDKAAGLEEIIEVMGKLTGKTIVTNETGIRFENPALVSNVIAAFKSLKVPIVCWFSGRLAQEPGHLPQAPCYAKQGTPMPQH